MVKVTKKQLDHLNPGDELFVLARKYPAKFVGRWDPTTVLVECNESVISGSQFNFEIQKTFSLEENKFYWTISIKDVYVKGDVKLMIIDKIREEIGLDE